MVYFLIFFTYESINLKTATFAIKAVSSVYAIFPFHTLVRKCVKSNFIDINKKS